MLGIALLSKISKQSSRSCSVGGVLSLEFGVHYRLFEFLRVASCRFGCLSVKGWSWDPEMLQNPCLSRCICKPLVVLLTKATSIKQSLAGPALHCCRHHCQQHPRSQRIHRLEWLQKHRRRLGSAEQSSAEPAQHCYRHLA